jgi:osmotically inducible protein OsmC
LDDGVLDFKVEIWIEIGGCRSAFTNPKQLFAAGYAACFDRALNLVARSQKVQLKDPKIKVSLSRLENGEGCFLLAADIYATIPEIVRETAKKLHQKKRHT